MLHCGHSNKQITKVLLSRPSCIYLQLDGEEKNSVERFSIDEIILIGVTNDFLVIFALYSECIVDGLLFTIYPFSLVALESLS